MAGLSFAYFLFYYVSILQLSYTIAEAKLFDISWREIFTQLVLTELDENQ